MAIIEVKVPQLSESVAEATLLQWKKKVGEAVAVDEILIDVETDKVVLEVPAPSAGVLVEIVAADGATVKAEELIARIDTTATASATATAAKPAAAAAGVAPVAAAAPASASHAGVAMPAAAKLMADNKLSAGSVPGTGKDGRVTKGDVLSAVAGGVPSTAAVIPTGVPTKALPQVAAPSVDFGERPEQRVPMTRLRARVAERLLQSQSTNAILTTFNEINMAPVMEMRKRMQERFEKEHGVQARFHEFLRESRGACLEEIPSAQCVGGRQRHRLPRLFRHRYRGGFAPWFGGADFAQRRPNELCRYRKENCRVRRESAGRQIGHGRDDRRHVLHL
jgi:2-oxoglutarate dehydrogenase E2 component (dihydrolipoamide succinyltransferase)